MEPIRDLIDALSKWADAIERGDSDDAKFRVEHFKRVAELLAIHPQFERMFQAYNAGCPSQEARAALECMTAFLQAVNDAAKRAPRNTS